MLAMNKLGYTPEDQVEYYVRYVHPKIWRILSFYESSRITINVDLHTAYLNVDTNILKFTIPYLIKKYIERTRRVINANTLEGIYKGPEIIQWMIIAGAGSHSYNKESDGMKEKISDILGIETIYRNLQYDKDSSEITDGKWRMFKNGNIKISSNSENGFQDLLNFVIPN